MNQVYVIDSVYHIYVTILLSYKNIKEDKKTLLVINVEGTKGIGMYAEPLRSLRTFEDVICFKGSSPVEDLKKNTSKYNSIFKRSKTLKTLFEKKNPHILDYHNYILNSEINLFHIIMPKAYFLIKYPKNKFRMIEEGIGTYTKKPRHIRRLKRQLLGFPKLMGYDKQVKEILVQEPSKMVDPILRAKSLKLDLILLLNNLSETDKKDIGRCFNLEALDVYSKKKKAVILTQPLIQSGFKVTPEEMIAIYSKMITDVQAKDMEVYLKLHPREEIDYEVVFKDANIKILPKILPIEVLNMDSSIYFDEAHTICSGAIDNLKNVGYRNNLGIDYLKK
ncbi:glycosyltransferase family 52 [Winogradskyella sp. R77965]|uniref:glycosyltransferase family 52 n=1 Tax=Winogradskyella sp. R77965 TaxID=3093872 RepID=UPI0037DCD996